MSRSNLPHAIVIMYNGSDIDESMFADLSGHIVEYMRHYGISIPEMTVMKYLDADAIAKLEVSDAARPKTKSERQTKDDPVENALMYISTRYKTFFSNRDTLALAFQLNKDLIQNPNDTALVNALKIVCEDETVYEPQLKKYGISRDALNTIQKWYCMSVHGN
jgi:hypothetical protein